MQDKAATGPALRLARHGRHQPRCDRSLGVRSEDARSAAEASRAARRVVLLSGDVHYCASTVMSYWTKGARRARAHRPVHRQRLQERDAVLHRHGRPRLAFAQRIVRANVGAERLGWNRKPTNRSFAARRAARRSDIPRALARASSTSADADSHVRLARGQHGQPGAAARLVVARGAGARPAPRRRPPASHCGRSILEVDAERDARRDQPPRALEGYRLPRRAHQRTVETLRHSRQILFRSNFGSRALRARGGVLHAVHEIYTAASPEDAGTDRRNRSLRAPRARPCRRPGVRARALRCSRSSRNAVV